MGSGMNMFRRRHMRNPTPFRSERIAFLDPILCVYWCTKYSEFALNPQKYNFEDFMRQMYTGRAPSWCQTNKQWFRDVDTLYIAHNIKNVHWVALEIDLVKETIKIYDPSITAVSYSDLLESVKPFARMIPYLRRSMTSPELKKTIKVKQYTISRVKGTPVNERSGDCGIYTLKFIECLALGHAYNRLADKHMNFLRMKFGIEVNDELPLPETTSPFHVESRNDEHVNKEAMIEAFKGLLVEL